MSATQPGKEAEHPYLNDPFLNEHVAWDSEYYLSIAVGGYDDPQMRAISRDYDWLLNPVTRLMKEEPGWTALNYAFFPFYPLLVRVAAFPLGLLGLRPVAAATLAGVLISLLGSLAAMLALFDLGRTSLGEKGGLRAAFYLLILPGSVFLAQVYTEGLFLGLSFGALAVARRRKWVWAALLAACATWTRPTGAMLILPMALFWWQDGGPQALWRKFTWAEAGKLLLICFPLLAFLVWYALLGERFQFIDSLYFNRRMLSLGQSFIMWLFAFFTMFLPNPPAAAYYLVEFTAIAYSLFACYSMWKEERILALYSLVVIIFALTSGIAQGMHRYALAAPVFFLLPARWGKNEAFDRAWTLGNVLIMGVFAAMFTFNFWAG